MDKEMELLFDLICWGVSCGNCILHRKGEDCEDLVEELGLNKLIEIYHTFSHEDKTNKLKGVRERWGYNLDHFKCILKVR